MAAIVFETALITTLRAGFFLSCRKLLLHSLYSDLKDLTSSSGSAGPDTPTSARTEFDLGALPTPATQSKHTSQSSLHSTISRLVFSACFSESCIMFLLLMCQAFDFFSPRARLLNWNFSLFILMALIILVVPLSLSLSLTAGSIRRSEISVLGPRILFSLIPVIVYILLLSYIPLPPALISASPDFTTTTLSRLIVLGTIILGLLSGFGAVTNSWQFIPSRGGNKVPSEEDISISEHALSRVRNELAQKRIEFSKQSTSSGTTWFSRVWGPGDDAQELVGLEALEYQMTLNLDTQRQARESAMFSSTLRGRLFHFGGMLFAGYCAIRIVSSLVHIFSSSTTRTNSSDLITYWLAHLGSLLLSHEIPREKIVLISWDISLVLVGVIILTSIRLVLRGVTRALRVTSRNLGASLMLLFLAQLMVLYLLSTLTQIRTTFPPTGTMEDTSNLFSTLPKYEFFGPLFDGSFLLSAGVSAIWMWGAQRFKEV